MIVTISDEYRIITDELQYIVQKSKVMKASRTTKAENVGKMKWHNVAYVQSLDYALRYIGKNITLINNDTKIIIDKLNNLYNKIDGLDATLKEKLIK
jgi:hypothetical protein